MQELTRIIKLIHPTSISSASRFIFRVVDLCNLIEGTMKERDEGE